MRPKKEQEVKGKNISKETKEPKKDSFETSLKKLKNYVQALEAGGKGIEESLEVFEKGVALARELFQRLEEAKKKAGVLAKNADGFSKKPLSDLDE